MEPEIKTKPGQRTFPLSTRQQEFFKNGRSMISKIQDQMNGALQYICMENELQGKQISLSEDASYVILDE
jgi:hypothetical protein